MINFLLFFSHLCFSLNYFPLILSPTQPFFIPLPSISCSLHSSFSLSPQTWWYLGQCTAVASVWEGGGKGELVTTASSQHTIQGLEVEGRGRGKELMGFIRLPYQCYQVIGKFVGLFMFFFFAFVCRIFFFPFLFLPLLVIGIFFLSLRFSFIFLYMCFLVLSLSLSLSLSHTHTHTHTHTMTLTRGWSSFSATFIIHFFFFLFFFAFLSSSVLLCLVLSRVTDLFIILSVVVVVFVVVVVVVDIVVVLFYFYFFSSSSSTSSSFYTTTTTSTALDLSFSSHTRADNLSCSKII